MSEWDRQRAIERIEELVETVETETMPVPVRELWVFGDIALGLDPVERLDVYLTKDILLTDEPDREAEFIDSHGIEGVGKTVSAEWATEHPEYLRATPGGYAAPEKCLAAHLLAEGEPIHLEVCNASFEDNVTQRLEGAKARDSYEELLDPRGVCLWIDGQRSDTAFEKLRAGEFVLPTLPDALEMLGLEEKEAARAAETVEAYRERQSGVSVRGDIV
ncbi:hypothetical protein SAMN05216226_109141 [Halovenus aranensis]|jgi:hypothetical protein|uniref:Uncharacterized protein n=1 Tax=Halovenus aranensis TaxID=890420 RepID=A0A1G8WRQ0_9EURY|nr:hypothetical protein [Halovenus aranensis]SDJ80280.1 hypothetical protein SAMN05216226_109141 [Halovenus aranensis]